MAWLFFPGLEEKLDRILQQQRRLMASFDDVLSKVRSQSTQIDGLRTLITGLKQQIADALQAVNLSPAEQAKIDEIFTEVSANEQKLAEAMNENTPAEGTNPSSQG